MHFISLPFFIFFIVLLMIYYTVPVRMQVIILLSGSLLFYGWADLRFLIYILFTGFTVFLAGVFIGRINEARQSFLNNSKSNQSPDKIIAERQKQSVQKRLYKIDRIRKAVFWLALFLNLGILAGTKYTNFFIGSINAVFGSSVSFIHLLVPMGISFYTFQSLGYLIDVYRGTVSYEKSLIRFMLFTSFFPQLIQGPISRYSDLSTTLYEPHVFSIDTILRGAERILWGLFKKLVIADRLKPLVDAVFSAGEGLTVTLAEERSGVIIFVGMIFFVLMLYADFSGGIDITIGIAETLGIKVTENFKQPFFSRSLKEYWRRWHITMGSWFRDYVFYPVSMSKGMRGLILWSKKHLGKTVARKAPVYIATFITWFATGIWHGAGWNYVCWGLANCLILILSEELEPLYAKLRNRLYICNTFVFRVFCSLRTFLLICFLNLFDCTGSFSAAVTAFSSIFTAWNSQVLFNGSVLQLGLGVGDFIVIACALFVVFCVDLYEYRASSFENGLDLRTRIHQLPSVLTMLIYYILFMAVIIFGVYGIGYDSVQFIYNRF